jgi:hypothetical protein
MQRKQTRSKSDRFLETVMVLNALLIALAMYANILADARPSTSTDRNWKAPQSQPPDFEPFREYEEFFRRSV